MRWLTSSAWMVAGQCRRPGRCGVAERGLGRAPTRSGGRRRRSQPGRHRGWPEDRWQHLRFPDRPGSSDLGRQPRRQRRLDQEAVAAAGTDRALILVIADARRHPNRQRAAAQCRRGRPARIHPRGHWWRHDRRRPECPGRLGPGRARWLARRWPALTEPQHGSARAVESVPGTTARAVEFQPSATAPAVESKLGATARAIDAIADRYVDECVTRYPEIATYLGCDGHDK